MPTFLYLEFDDAYAPIHTIRRQHRALFRTRDEADAYARARQKDGYVIFAIDPATMTVACAQEPS